VTSDPVLLSAEDVLWYSDDARYADGYDDTVRMAAELLLAREVLTLIKAGEIANYNAAPGWGIWDEGDYEPLADARPDLAAYLNALPKEDS